MKNYEKSTCRFVKEFANYRLSIYKDCLKNFPDNKNNILCIIRIESIVSTFDKSLISATEAMKCIAYADEWARSVIAAGEFEMMVKKSK